jgi:hypothetical protein
MARICRRVFAAGALPTFALGTAGALHALRTPSQTHKAAAVHRQKPRCPDVLAPTAPAVDEMQY